jgi:HEAT repeat protein
VRDMLAYAVVAFGGPKEAMPALVEIIEEEKPVQFEGPILAAAEALLGIEGEAGAARLFTHMENRRVSSPFILLVMKATAKMGSKELMPHAYQFLYHPEKAVRKAAAQALKEIDAATAKQLFLEKSYAINSETRLRVAEALPLFDDAEVRARLAEMTKDPDAAVANMATTALKALEPVAMR